ncbi:phosphoribosyltransferase [Candidatus Bathyarchaeota archaeon]|nr:phosphoribosyltransferase [Candidatus Bathyarchaeota archaeon]
MSSEFEVPSWNQIYRMLLNIAEKIRRDRFIPDIIVGVSRGGWPPARVLSDLLGNPNLANVKVEFYLGIAETKETPVLTQPISMSVQEKKVLVVDEIADTGMSLKLVKEHIAREGALEIKIATIYYKPWSITVPEYYEKESSCWIVFPWEIRETIKKIVKDCKERKKSLEEKAAELIRAGVPKRLVRKFLKEIIEEED